MQQKESNVKSGGREEEEENETSRRNATTKSNAQLLSTTQVTTRSERGGGGLEPSIRTSDVLTQSAAKSEGIFKKRRKKSVTFDLHQPGREVSEMCEFLKSTF